MDGGFTWLLLMTYLWILGRRASSRKAAGESFARTKDLHGRLSDVMIGLIIIHAFPRFPVSPTTHRKYLMGILRKLSSSIFSSNWGHLSEQQFIFTMSLLRA